MPDAGDGTPPVPTPDMFTDPPSEAAFEIPRDLRWLTPRYEFVRELGRGMAVVYLARQRDGVAGPGANEPGREVAIKVVAPPHAADRETVERFAREARTATALKHANIVRTLAIETSGDAVAIVNEYISGETLRTTLQRGPFTFDRAAAVLRDVAAALAHAHAARFVHRDVKPENIFIETGTGHALLGDFGIARPIDSDALLTHDGASLGTPAYMAPEQVDGLAVDERTDVYALGLIGWEMLTGRRPWQGETLYSLLQKQKHEPLPDLARVRPDVPVYLHRAISVALAKDPADRWQSAEAMLIQLAPIPERDEDAFPEPESGAASSSETDAVALASGATMRFASADLDAVQPVAPPVGALAVPPAEYLRDAAIVSRLPERRRRGVGRWIAAAVAAAAVAAGAFVATHRAPAPSTGDAQLDSLLTMTARRAPAPLAGVPPTSARRDTVADSSTAAPVTPATAAPVATPSSSPPDTIVPVAPGRTAARDACQSTGNAEQRRCLMALVYRSDAVLTRNYQSLIRTLRQRAGGIAEPPSVRALRAEQRAWVDARDRECARQQPISRNPRWGVARAPCFAGFSTRRAAVLSARLRGRLPMAP